MNRLKFPLLLVLGGMMLLNWLPPAQAQDGRSHWLFPNHPRLRRITKAVGFGAATGGLAAPILGVGAAAGAAAGAAEHGSVRAWKDKHDLKKGKRLDHHIW